MCAALPLFETGASCKNNKEKVSDMNNENKTETEKIRRTR